MSELAVTDIRILQRQDDKTLASWWSLLNRFEWPEAVPDPEPAEYTPGDSDRRGLLMKWIQKSIGIKECLRDWNKDRMTNEEFELWYESGPRVNGAADG